MSTMVIAGAFIGAMVSGAVHGIRGGSGNGAFLAMLGGAAAGAAGGYAGGALSGVAGSQVGGALGSTLGSTGIPISTLVSAGGRVAAGIMSPDYPQQSIVPDFTKAREELKRQGITSDKEYYKYIMNQKSYTTEALKKVKQGTGEGGVITVGDLMQAVDPTGLAPTEGEMTLERWEAIQPIYTETLFSQYTGGYRNLGMSTEIEEAKEGLVRENALGPQFTKSGIPLQEDKETGLYRPMTPFSFKNPIKEYEEKLQSSPELFSFPESGSTQGIDIPTGDIGGNILPGEESPTQDKYYTEPQAQSDSQIESPGRIDSSRQTARYNSFAAARASEDALRAKSLLSTSKSLNLPRFDEEYGLASNKFSQKPKPFN